MSWPKCGGSPQVTDVVAETLIRLTAVDETLRLRVRKWLDESDRLDFDTSLLASQIRVDRQMASAIVEALVRAGVLSQEAVQVCVAENCGVALSPDSLADGVCGTCGADLSEFPPRPVDRYRRERPGSRDVGWVIALHGIRTRGSWQEQLQWLIDSRFRYTVPFQNWKYGRIFVGALAPALQARFVRRFLGDVTLARAQILAIDGFVGATDPDVIAHSFGTWILAHALLADPSLRVGRVVLIGSIVRPDWDWASLVDNGQVQAVLNYCGDRDPWVKLAQFAIPDSGPSGVIGFTRRADRVFNLMNSGGTHSSSFAPVSLPATFDSVWGPFLTARDRALTNELMETSGSWRPSRLRAPACLAAIVTVMVVIAAAIWLAA